jgi:D-beta-D-heptose 7-phosphate kinase / D-beta-D-heptose 1-phosphate adenosyltransferase
MRQHAGENGLVLVLVNSDDYIRRTKNREPMFPLEDRQELLLALKYVNIALPTDSDEPSKLLSLIQPDIWVKGPEYAPEIYGGPVPETHTVESYGGAIVFIDVGYTNHGSDLRR